jgi:adenine-specific DNA glycosylase
MSQKLVAEHAGEVPADMEKLTALPGVGRKTANVVLGHALGVPGLPWIGTCSGCRIESALRRATTPSRRAAVVLQAAAESWTLASDVQILHGRRICRPKPLCDECSFVTTATTTARSFRASCHGPQRARRCSHKEHEDHKEKERSKTTRPDFADLCVRRVLCGKTLVPFGAL